MTEAEDLMAGQEAAAIFVAHLTGVRAQFVEAGWSGRGAEEAALELLRAGRGAS